jgi:hypothetical protein
VEKRDVYKLPNIHDPTQDGNFLDEQGNMIKPTSVVDYKHHMGFVNKVDRTANSY